MPIDDRVDALFASGVAAIPTVTAGWTGNDWSRPACGVWTGTDLAGHLVTVIGWYHDWLDRAEAAVSSPAFPASDLDARTAASLSALPSGAGPDRIEEFVARAVTYRERLGTTWDIPFGYPRGTVTSGLHAALAAWEWHVHAWDFATAAGSTHRPDDAATLYERGMTCFCTATGIEPPPVPDDPWVEILRRNGRVA